MKNHLLGLGSVLDEIPTNTLNVLRESITEQEALMKEYAYKIALEKKKKIEFIETFMYGIVDAFTSIFAAKCRNGIITMIGSVRLLYDFSSFSPQNFPKLNIAFTNLLEAYNVIYAHCDFTNLLDQFSAYFEFSNWEQYVVLASRIGGLFVYDFWELKDCVDRGYEYSIGYDAGYCIGAGIKMVLDTVL